MRKSIPQKVIDELLRKQNNRCANRPEGVNSYKCPMWIIRNGLFDESGYQIDHIHELTITQDNSLENLQALCPCCHSVKTKVWLSQPRLNRKVPFTTAERIQGRATMDELDDNNKSKKRKKYDPEYAPMDLGFGSSPEKKYLLKFI